MDPRLQNGKPKCTVIEKFDRSAVLLFKNGKKRKKFANLDEAKRYANEQGLEITIDHIMRTVQWNNRR